MKKRIRRGRVKSFAARDGRVKGAAPRDESPPVQEGKVAHGAIILPKDKIKQPTGDDLEDQSSLRILESIGNRTPDKF